MEKSKKEKQQREMRQTLTSMANLKPTLLTPIKESTSSLLTKLHPQIREVNTLRVLTLIEIIYLLETYLELMEKHHPHYLNSFSVGIIGGGVSGRLVLHSILPLCKDGLNPANIILSTRQNENFKSYVQHFGINACFDNELAARQSDFLIIATPATLDNSTIVDLVPILQERVSPSDKINKTFISSQLLTKIPAEKSQLSSNQDQKKKVQEKAFSTSIMKEEIRPFKPLVYILTSDFSEEKCRKLFPFPVLTPSVRAKDIQNISETLKIFVTQDPDQFEQYKKIFSWWLTQQQETKPLDSLESQRQSELTQSKVSISSQYVNTKLSRIINVLSFVIDLSSKSHSIASSVSNTVSLSENPSDKRREEAIAQVVEAMTATGEAEETILKKLRKWQMANNNFLA